MALFRAHGRRTLVGVLMGRAPSSLGGPGGACAVTARAPERGAWHGQFYTCTPGLTLPCHPPAMPQVRRMYLAMPDAIHIDQPGCRAWASRHFKSSAGVGARGVACVVGSCGGPVWWQMLAGAQGYLAIQSKAAPSDCKAGHLIITTAGRHAGRAGSNMLPLMTVHCCAVWDMAPAAGSRSMATRALRRTGTPLSSAIEASCQAASMAWEKLGLPALNTQPILHAAALLSHSTSSSTVPCTSPRPTPPFSVVRAAQPAPAALAQGCAPGGCAAALAVPARALPGAAGHSSQSRGGREGAGEWLPHPGPGVGAHAPSGWHSHCREGSRARGFGGRREHSAQLWDPLRKPSASNPWPPGPPDPRPPTHPPRAPDPLPAAQGWPQRRVAEAAGGRGQRGGGLPAPHAPAAHREGPAGHGTRVGAAAHRVQQPADLPRASGAWVGEWEGERVGGRE